MISVIISYYKHNNFASIQENIRETIGVPYELIGIYNPGEMGLSQAYNRGAANARFDNLCFVHDDVIFLNQGWGGFILDALHLGWGLLGVAGSAWKPRLPFGWATGLAGCDHYHIYHGLPNGERKLYSSGSVQLKEIKNVSVLDGVFLCCTKPLYNQVRFNETQFPGFHGYDIDFTLRSSRLTKVGVIGTISLVHQSEGRFDDAWLESGFCCAQLHWNTLPSGILPPDFNEGDANSKVIQFWRNRLINEPLTSTMRKKLLQGFPEWKQKKSFFSWMKHTCRGIWK
jgi:hypothetical protein